MLFSSGQGATTTILMAHLKAGDHIVATEDLYGGALRLFRDVLEPMGVTTTLVPTAPRPKLEEAIRPETREVVIGRGDASAMGPRPVRARARSSVSSPGKARNGHPGSP